MRNLILIALAVSACVAETAPQANPEAPVQDGAGQSASEDAERAFLQRYDSCDAGRIADLVGQAYDPEQDQRILQSANAGGIRLIRPGQPIAMDYSGGRLNIELDDQGTVTRVWCG